MRVDDLDTAERLTARVFTAQPNGGWDERPPRSRARWIGRVRHLLQTDPGGCWVADDGTVTGVVASARRDLLWVLSTFAVHPDHQGQGIGAALLQAAIDYGHGCLRGMLCALPNPPALRRYRLAGFDLHPTLRLTGQVDQNVLPAIDGVRGGGTADLDLVDSVDRQVRGATHRPDHDIMLAHGSLLICDLLTGGGYAIVEDGIVGPLAATNRAVARRLLWAAIARSASENEIRVRYLTPQQGWAVDVGIAAGLRVETDGCLALRHMAPPMPYLPSVSFA